jgi:hypothetical protein
VVTQDKERGSDSGDEEKKDKKDKKKKKDKDRTGPANHTF